MTPDLSAGRTELFVTLVSLFLLRLLHSVYILKKKKILNMLEGFSKGTALLHFQSVLLVDLTTRICDRPFSLRDGRCVFSAGSTTGCFPETAAILKGKGPQEYE